MTPTISVEVAGTRQSTQFEAIIDTGFDGDICIPIDAAVTLGLELVGIDDVELADGSHRRELTFSGFAKLLEEKREVAISLTEGEEALVGTRLLSGCHLSIDFVSGKVRLLRKPTGRR